MKLPLKILIHGIYWLVFMAFSIGVSITEKQLGDWPAMYNFAPHLVVNTIWALIIFYVFYFYFIKFFENRQFVKYLLFSVLTSTFITLIFLPIHKFIYPQFEIYTFRSTVPTIVGTFIIAQCGCLIGGFENWFSNIKIKAELENRNLRNELELLKSQVNPHFLFNTLNNIDSLIHTSPKDASHSLITLSDLLRYMIYDTQVDKILLQKEADYINRYVKLQKLRFKKPESIALQIDTTCGDDYIAPMLFVPFIENAFKYAYNTGKMPIVEIKLHCSEKKLRFNCSNYFNTEAPINTRTGGVGLENVKRRLELLYPQKHNLKISRQNQIFNVDLEIEL